MSAHNNPGDYMVSIYNGEGERIDRMTATYLGQAHMLGQDALAAMKAGSYVVHRCIANTARDAHKWLPEKEWKK